MNKKRIPKKLKHDAIVEAIFEMRFDPVTIPEVLIGRLVDSPNWGQFTKQRLPAYDIPAQVRQLQPEFRYQAIFELAAPGRHQLIRIGPQVLSVHELAPYIGWANFEPILHETVDRLFSQSDEITVNRLGLRYLNALTPDVHGVGGFSEMDVQIEVCGERLVDNVNLNYTRAPAEDISCTARVATIEFVQGTVPPRTSVFIDVDIFTPDGFQTRAGAVVKTWLGSAHDHEKATFFGVLHQETIDALAEE